jgi:anthranilate synthase component I
MSAPLRAVSPPFEEFAKAHAAGAGVVWTQRTGDLETPVSALLKLGADQPGSLLLESVQGGEYRGRYSIIGVKPDLVWRVRAGRAEASRGGFGETAFRPQRDGPLKSLRKLLTRSALKLPDALPPMAAGLFGYLGYDMVRLMEKLPEQAPDPIGTPDAMLVRPTVIAVFDNVTSEITLVTPARKRANETARVAFDRACARLQRASRALDRPLPRQAEGYAHDIAAPRSNTSPEAYRAVVEKCKAYTRAGACRRSGGWSPSRRASAPEFPGLIRPTRNPRSSRRTGRARD